MKKKIGLISSIAVLSLLLACTGNHPASSGKDTAENNMMHLKA